MAKRMRVREFGVEVVEGIPGSGKSFLLVERMLDVLTAKRRPVYTNLPLRWRVCRRFLKNRGGAKLANLLFNLTPGHFRAFIARAALRQQHRDRLRDFRTARPMSFQESEAAFVAEHGPDVVDGPGANWIPAGAVIIIDEVHHWFSMRDQKNEPAELLTYLTMLRHHVHWLWVASQDRMQISLAFRRQAQCYWCVRNVAMDKLVWGLRFKHLGISGMAYVAYTPEAEGAKGEKGEPFANYIRFPWLPRHRWKFRLYDSFTHVGGVKQIERAIQSARLSVGLTASGRDEEHERQQQESAMPIKKSVLRRASSWVFWKSIKLACLVGVVGVAYLAGGGGVASDKGDADQGMVASTDDAERIGVVAGDSLVESSAPNAWGTWDQAGSRFVRISGQRVAVGGRVGSAILHHISASPRALVLELDLDLWVWRWGEAEPRRVGSISEIEACLIAIGD